MDKLKQLVRNKLKDKEVTIPAELLFDLIQVCNWYQATFDTHETNLQENTTAFVRGEAISRLIPLTRESQNEASE